MSRGAAALAGALCLAPLAVTAAPPANPTSRTLGDALRAIGAFDGLGPDRGVVDRSGAGADRSGDPLAAPPVDHPTERPAAAAVDPRLVPPPPSETVWPRIVIVSGVALVVAGIAGMVASPGCATRDGADRCLDAHGSAPLWPALVVVGLGATITGNYWDRWTRLDDVPPAQPGTR